VQWSVTLTSLLRTKSCCQRKWSTEPIAGRMPGLKELQVGSYSTESGRVPRCFTSPTPEQNSVLCLHLYCPIHLRDIPWLVCMLPLGTQAAKFLVINSVPSTQRREASKVKAAQKWVTDTRPALPSTHMQQQTVHWKLQEIPASYC
jgi:hypothetical protein